MTTIIVSFLFILLLGLMFIIYNIGNIRKIKNNYIKNNVIGYKNVKSPTKNSTYRNNKNSTYRNNKNYNYKKNEKTIYSELTSDNDY